MIECEASDLHLTVGVPPQFRIHGEMVASARSPLTFGQTQALAYSLLTEDLRMRFEETRELDLSFGIQGLARFRGNIYWQRGSVAMAIRKIPFDVMSFDALGLPKVVRDFAYRHKGLVLFTGPTGSGKSTSLATLIDIVNRERRCHVVTIEDPIEFIHSHKMSIVNQREVNSDTKSFASALKYVLRQDPDVILVGEMRDFETIAAALTLAETGHLVFATLHTNSAPESVSRIVDVFPPHQQTQVLAQLAFTLEGVVTQQLIRRADGKGRILVAEVMICTPAIRAIIRERKTHQIYSLMQAGQRYGMRTMNMSLFEAYSAGHISQADMISRSPDPKDLELMMGKRTIPLKQAA
jgi:twitching motility protein PilT